MMLPMIFTALFFAFNQPIAIAPLPISTPLATPAPALIVLDTIPDPVLYPLSPIPPNNRILRDTVVGRETMPFFPGCEDITGDYNFKKACADKKMMDWIYAQIKYPEQAIKEGIAGMVIVKFVVDENGYIQDAQIQKGIGGGCEEEALRVINEMNNLPQRWIPAMRFGLPIKVKYTLPIKFKIPK